MLIKIPKGWEIPEREATPEAASQNRRVFLETLGFAGLDALVASSLKAAVTNHPLYPAKRNPKYELDRPITPEWAATGYNNFYEFTIEKQVVKDLVDKFQISPWKVEVTGLVNKPRTYDFDDLVRRFPLEERLYRMRCVEAWSMAVPWTGFPISALIKEVDPKPTAKFMRMVTLYRPKEMPGIGSQPHYPWPYFEALRMDEAMNELALFVTGLYGHSLPKQNGAPFRLITPWKYGLKSIKSIVKIEFTAKRPPTLWNVAVPDEYGWYSNVNPKRPHPRWSQAHEKVIPTMESRPTLMYNGYEKYVAALYKGNEY
ncbi:MAG TPA: protein-methionine-sulfoxide reductase catalytic subunit MsrP [Bryobacterales bacterium]|nr:protein-methionine-sulfoxide reductase catalytic subunit MsrP [Bryobacterales bacterium]